MRADRLLSLLLLLQVHRRITARELAERLEVSERTIHRDMEALSMAGIPVVAERGSCGGWSLLEAYRTNLNGLTEPEIQSLFLTRPVQLLTDLGLHKAAEEASLKLFVALPQRQRQDAEYVSQRIYIDATSWHQREEAVPALSILQQALWQERKVHFTYPRGTTLVERLVDPLGLVAKGSVWYLVAGVEGQMRSYRVSRIQDVSLSDQSFVRPIAFDLAAFWRQSSQNFQATLPCYHVLLRAAPEAVERIYSASRLFRIGQVAEADEAGWITFKLRFETSHEACAAIISFGAGVEILDPLELRVQILQLAQSVVEHYWSATEIECRE
ncbi:helix-turn-helix transcriptional regulator [Dictyobacter arantiisoli]|uniref:Transcriptional regulator n=1 Tax=Dictyobacter arantiisoli TaxID=2014874 RepID=A0A5A5T663_9CHLR|nr:YafY family protein [Dictyobacter arantiisoli]GCF06940.1 transcriptional regulator [Dictyobacter arantiisoli]